MAREGKWEGAKYSQGWWERFARQANPILRSFKISIFFVTALSGMITHTMLLGNALSRTGTHTMLLGNALSRTGTHAMLLGNADQG